MIEGRKSGGLRIHVPAHWVDNTHPLCFVDAQVLTWCDGVNRLLRCRYLPITEWLYHAASVRRDKESDPERG